MPVGEVVTDQFGNIDKALTKAVNQFDRTMLFGMPVEKSPMDRARELVDLVKNTPKDLKNDQAILCDRESYKALKANAPLPVAPGSALNTVYGLPVVVDATLPANTVILGPLPQPAVPKPDHVVMVRKVTEFVTLVHGEDNFIDHPFSGPDFIVQVIHVMTGKEAEHVEVVRRASDVLLRWTLHDASPVEQPSISVMCVMIG